MNAPPRLSVWRKATPGITLMILAPLLAEVLPGATRFSSLFVFPIEICVWGGGTLLIRYIVRRWQLGWRNMLLLAVALAIAEECLIQQTSLAPMVLQIKGQVYARACGVNYVYFLWALIYEMVFVVFLPINLAEQVFWDRRDEWWVSRIGLVAVVASFLIASYLAWYTWTQIARPNVFHVPAYNPPLAAILAAVVAVGVLVLFAVGPLRDLLARPSKPLSPPAPWLLGTAAAVWAALLFGIVLLAFGIAPAFPPSLAVSIGMLLAAGALAFLPRWAGDRGWNRSHQFAVIFGTMLGSMMAGFIGFIGAASVDLYFKIVVDAIAVALMIALGTRIRKQSRVGELAQ